MGKFLESEKPHQAHFKATAPYFTEQAREPGIYKQQAYPFCLPREFAHENLFPFADQPESLAALLRPLYPSLDHMLPLEADSFVTLEWIGERNYLNERLSRNRKRTRGTNFTSADAAVMFKLHDGRRQIVLIEWKYTESYYSTPYHTARSGTDRTAIYRPLYRLDDCPLDKELLGEFDYLFYEPFYQLMRQQFLAQ